MGGDAIYQKSEKPEEETTSAAIAFDQFSFSLNVEPRSQQPTGATESSFTTQPNEALAKQESPEASNILKDVLLNVPLPYDYAGGKNLSLNERMMQAAERATSNIANLKKAESQSRTTDYDIEYERLSLREATNTEKKEFWLPPNLSGAPVLPEGQRSTLNDQSKNSVITPFEYRELARQQAEKIFSEHPELKDQLNGKRIVLNEGHSDHKDPGSPNSGHETHKGCNCTDNVKELNLNRWSTAVLGELVKLSGGSVRFIDQSDTQDKTAGKDRGMPWLAKKMADAKPDLVLSIHHDHNPDLEKNGPVRGTFTMINSTANPESLRFAQKLQQNAQQQGNEPGFEDPDDKAGSKGGLWDNEHSRKMGIQKLPVGAPIALREQFNMTNPRAQDAAAIANMQYGNLKAMIEFFQGH